MFQTISMPVRQGVQHLLNSPHLNLQPRTQKLEIAGIYAFLSAIPTEYVVL
ncbi:hypothetical protein [Nostoc sp. DedQUE09]|uniref:hypothetical protein n=1 Tax=Nostoc sp. DedQUE09 TaxID=3075394 RepID=UPI002AD33D75|nr:hypothetical protein [Nostoc sp. DedQUE09]MDZ7955323.1 hypothetical protein [Nostoc sp. DedQUE09]